MIVRIKLNVGPQIKKTTGKNRNTALAIASLVTPATLLAFVLAFWRMAADMGVTSAFPITDGLFSHWQVWLAIALCAQLFTTVLNRYGRDGHFKISRPLARD